MSIDDTRCDNYDDWRSSNYYYGNTYDDCGCDGNNSDASDSNISFKFVINTVKIRIKE